MVHVYILTAKYGCRVVCLRGRTQGAIIFINIGMYYKWISLRRCPVTYGRDISQQLRLAHEKGMLGF